MSANDISVFGIYASVADAEAGTADLISAGFPSTEISVLLADGRSKRELEGAGSAGAVGAVLCGALGILKAASVRVVQGMGPIILAGPLVDRMQRSGSEEAPGLAAALVDWGIPAEAAKACEGRIQDGGTLLAVRCESPERDKRARQILNSSGADDVAVLSESGVAKAEALI